MANGFAFIPFQARGSAKRSVFLLVLRQPRRDALRVFDDRNAPAVVRDVAGGHDDGAAEAFDLGECGVNVIDGDVGHPLRGLGAAVGALHVGDAAEHFAPASEHVIAGHRFAFALPADEGCVEADRCCGVGGAEFRPSEVALCVAELSHNDFGLDLWFEHAALGAPADQ